MLKSGPFAFGPPLAEGAIRQRLDDFMVEEDLGFCPAPDETGEHWWLWIEKRGQNTAWVASALAEAAGLHPSKASFAGLKDRHAVTRQWISLHLGQRPTPKVDDIAIEGVVILHAIRSSKKLQRGRLKGNRFELVVRDLVPDQGKTQVMQDELHHRLSTLKDQGVPNFFGEQRFGVNNVAKARRLFAGELRGQRSKKKRGFYLSAARSYLFNEVLAERVREGTWSELLPGDVAMLDGSQSFFELRPGQQTDPEIMARLGRLDIHPTGPLPGVGDEVVSDEVAALEARCLARHPDLVEGLTNFKVKAMRRALRAPVRDLHWHWLDGRTLKLEFRLGQGAFATTVLRELVAYSS